MIRIRSINLRSIAVASGLAAMILPIWFVTRETIDIKRISALLLLPAALVWGLRKNWPDTGREKPGESSTTILLVFAAFVLYVLVNWYVLSYPFYGTRGLVQLWICFLSFLAGAVLLSRPGIVQAFSTGMIVCGVASTLYMYAEYFGYVTGMGKHQWVSGLMGNANLYGFLMISSIVWGTYWLFFANSRAARFIVMIMVFFFFSGVAISGSRGSLVLVTGGMITASIVFFLGTKHQISLQHRVTVLLMFLVVGLVLVASDSVWRRIAQILVERGEAGSVKVRVLLYQAQISLFKEHPLFGSGVGSFIHEAVRYYPRVLRDHVTDFAVAHSGHNDYLQALVDLGLFGMIFYAFFLGGAIVRGVRNWRKTSDPVTAVFTVQLVLMVIHGAYSVSTRNEPGSILLWSAAGFLWQKPFSHVHGMVSVRRQRIALWTVGALHLLVFALFLRILAAEAFFVASCRSEDATAKRRLLLSKALAIYPNHPDALFDAAYIAAKSNRPDVAEKLLYHLDRVAPNYHLTSFVRAILKHRVGEYKQALQQVNAALEIAPNSLDVQRVKAMVLGSMGRCAQLEELQSRHAIHRNLLEDSLLSVKSMKEEEFMCGYRRGISAVRRAIGGKALLQQHKDRLRSRISIQARRFETIERILSVPCEKKGKAPRLDDRRTKLVRNR